VVVVVVEVGAVVVPPAGVEVTVEVTGAGPLGLAPAVTPWSAGVR
jgi:hypothetical protein